jgi:sulfur carrier protein ThiS
MMIELRLHGGLATQLPRGRGQIELPDGATLDAILERFGVSRVACICLRNGAPASPTTPLKDGDRVQIVPPMAGGS